MDRPSTLTVVSHPIVRNKLTHLRDKHTGYARFSNLIFELSLFLIYEALESLKLQTVEIETPLEPMESHVCGEKVTFIPILRAGIRMADAGQTVLHSASIRHLGLNRNEKTLQPTCYFEKRPTSPDELGHCVVLDPMIATGGSAIDAINRAKEWGAKHITFIGILASEVGIATLHGAHPEVHAFIAGLDPRLNEHGYILPGLGDAGDRQYHT